MNSFRTLLFVIVSLLSVPAASHAGDPAVGVGTQADRDLKTKVTANVNELNRRMTTKYLGHPDYIVAPVLNEPIRQAINMLMKSPNDLVTQEQVTPDLILGQIAGITGGAKTQMLRDYIQWRIELNLLRTDRKDIQNGTANKEMDLTKIDARGTDLKLMESLNGPNLSFSKRYELFLDTAALIVYDEASHYAQPSKDLEGDLSRDLAHIKRAWLTAKDHEVKAERKVKPVEPTSQQFANNEDFRQALETYAQELLEYQTAQAFGRAKDEDGLRKTYDELVQKRVEQFEATKLKREKLFDFLTRLWSALSGGTYSEGEETAVAEKQRTDINEAFVELARFHAKYEHDTLLKRANELQANIGKAKAKIAVSKTEMDSLLAQREKLRAKLHDFEDSSPLKIEEWAEKNKMMDEMRRLRLEGKVVPEFFDQMLESLVADPTHSRRGTVGFKADKEQAKDADVNTFRETAQRILADQIRLLDHKVEDLEPRIENERSAVSTAIRQRIAWAEKDGKVRSSENKTGNDLAAELAKLEANYDHAIDSGLKVKAGQNAVADFVRTLNPKILADFSPAFATHLGDLDNKAEAWIEHFKNAQDPALQFAQMLEMNPAKTREIVRKAIVNHTVDTKGKFLGNMKVIWLTNIRKLEAEIAEKLAAVHEKGREVGWNEYAGWYREALNQPEYRSWDRDLMDDHFPGLFAPLMSEKEKDGKKEALGNVNAKKRRLTSPRGSIFIGPPTAQQLLNHATTTMKALYDQWKAKRLEKGSMFNGDLFVHENVPALFVRDGDKVELGPNAVIQHVREVMGTLLAQLGEYADRQERLRPGKPVDMNVGIINEKLDGNNHVLRIRAIHPDYKQEGGKILHGSAASGAAWARSTSKEVVIGDGYLHHFRPSKDFESKPVVKVTANDVMRDMYARWRSDLKKNGINIKGTFHIHDSVPILAAHDGVTPENGPHISTENVHDAFGEMLEQLAVRLEKNKGAAQTAMEINIDVTPHSADGKTSLKIHPEIRVGGSTQAARGNYWTGPGVAEITDAYVGYSTRGQPGTDAATQEPERTYVFAAEDAIQFGKNIPATRQELDAINLAIKQDADAKKADEEAKVAARELAVHNAELNRRAAEERAEEEARAAQMKVEADARAAENQKIHDMQNKKLEELSRLIARLAKSGEDPTEALTKFSEELDPRTRELLRHELGDRVLRRNRGYRPEHLYVWLKNEYAHHADVDKFVVDHFATLAKSSGRNLMSLFSNLVSDPDVRDNLFESLRPGGYNNLLRRTLCFVSMGRLYNRGVPKSARGDVEWHPPKGWDFVPSIPFVGGKK